jgi:hypothetical protein
MDDTVADRSDDLAIMCAGRSAAAPTRWRWRMAEGLRARRRGSLVHPDRREGPQTDASRAAPAPEVSSSPTTDGEHACPATDPARAAADLAATAGGAGSGVIRTLFGTDRGDSSSGDGRTESLRGTSAPSGSTSTGELPSQVLDLAKHWHDPTATGYRPCRPRSRAHDCSVISPGRVGPGSSPARPPRLC